MNPLPHTVLFSIRQFCDAANTTVLTPLLSVVLKYEFLMVTFWLLRILVDPLPHPYPLVRRGLLGGSGQAKDPPAGPGDLKVSNAYSRWKAEREKRESILRAEGNKQSQILVAEGKKEAQILEAEAEKEAAILRADAQRAAKILEAQGDAEAILKVQQATAEGIRMLKEAGPDTGVISLKSLEAFAKAADGKATKIIIPSELQSLAGLVTSAIEIAKPEEKKD